ncbi:MAG: coenzyme F420-0:L-glutamate ligase [Gammaproteobacteria bacterium]|nr:coenzyme F420-0:L-glutamate ligase [Gammaproteobacteria bacterium]
MPAPSARLELIAVPGLPLVQAGDDLATLVLAALPAAGLVLQDGDTLAFAQKIVSKAEGRMVDLATVVPSPQAADLARLVRKDPRLVELILRESRRVVRCAPDVLIVEQRLGFIMANAGVDQSNVAGGGEFALLLPEDPDASAARLREAFGARAGCDLAVLITDSFGRPWRQGTAGVAIGCAGLPALVDLRGEPDLFGRRLRVTTVGHADEVAAAASLLMGQSAEGQPVVLIRGLHCDRPAAPAAALLRPADEDLFR